MKKFLTILLQIVIVLIGVAVLVFMLWEPHLEGRNANATLFQIYFNDLFLAYAYAGSIAFFVALYQAFKALRYIREDKTFSNETFQALRTIKYCAIIIIGMVFAAEVWLITTMRGKDDIAGGVAMGVFIILISTVVALVATIFQQKIHNTRSIQKNI